MCEQDPSVAVTAQAIEVSFGRRWGVWLSDTGWWWATRTHALTAEQLGAGCLPHLHADNPDELTELIRHQERLTWTANPGKTPDDRPHATRPTHDQP